MSNAPYLGLRHRNNIFKEWRALFLQVKEPCREFVALASSAPR